MADALCVAASLESIRISAHGIALEYRRDNAEMLLEDLEEALEFSPERPHLLFADIEWAPTISLKADGMRDPESKNVITLSLEGAQHLVEMLQEALEDDVL